MKKGFRILKFKRDKQIFEIRDVTKSFDGRPILKNISIDRSDGVSSLKKIMKSCAEHIHENRTIIIFPEGTRSVYGTKANLKRGIFKIISNLRLQSIY